MNDVIRASNEHSDWARQGMQMIQDAATKPLHADIEHLMLALVQQETVLNECEALLKETISEDGVCADFDSRLAAYWERSKALADWRTRDMLIAQRPRNETVEVAVDARRYRRLQILGCAVMGTPQLEHGTVSRFSNLDAILDADIAAHPSRGEYAQKANSCVCGEPNSPGTHRTDGPCLAPIGDHHP